MHDPLDSTQAQRLLNCLPEPIAFALQDYATTYQLSIAQVLELAIATFLDLDAVTLDRCDHQSIGQLKANAAILDTLFDALEQGKQLFKEDAWFQVFCQQRRGQRLADPTD